MNIKDFFAQKDNPPELYWTLVIEPGWVQAGAWYIKDGIAEVASIGPGAAWESEEDLLSATDAALSACVQKLPEELPEPSKTVFGVSSAWVEGGEIKSDHLSQIKKICTELALTPTGFVVLPEAIANLYKSEEGTPINAVILGLGKEFLEISIFKLGNLVGTAHVGRSLSVVEDTVEGLSRFEGAAPLPSRIIVFDGKEGELDEAKNSLSSATWEGIEKVKFLHTPKVELVSPERKILATSLAGAAEIGAATKVQSGEEEATNVEEPKETLSATELGFAIGEDVSLKTEAPKEVQPPMPTVQETQAPTHQGTGMMQKTRGILHGFYGKVVAGVSSTPSFFSGKKTLPLIGVIVILVAAVAAIWWFVPKATVSIYVSPKKFDKSLEITFDPGGGSDVENGLVPASVVSADVSGEKTKSTSGVKLVGDRAKGTVKIGNSTSNDILLKSGAILVSSSDLRFTTDSTASISAALDSFNPGVANVGVTAADIGAQYNLGNGEIFKVSNYPKAEVSAQATSDFSGGSSKEISAVSKDDQDSLEKSLEGELTDQAKAKLNDGLSGGQLLVDNFISFDPSNENFDHKVGDEASTLKLNLTMTAKTISVDRTKLADVVREKLKGEVPDGFVLRDTQINYTFNFKQENNGKYVYSVDASANFLPEINQDEIKKKIVGRLPGVVQSYLTTIPGFSKAQVYINPHFPGIFGTLPRVAKNISIEITAER